MKFVKKDSMNGQIKASPLTSHLNITIRLSNSQGETWSGKSKLLLYLYLQTRNGYDEITRGGADRSIILNIFQLAYNVNTITKIIRLHQGLRKSKPVNRQCVKKKWEKETDTAIDEND